MQKREQAVLNKSLGRAANDSIRPPPSQQQQHRQQQSVTNANGEIEVTANAGLTSITNTNVLMNETLERMKFSLNKINIQLLEAEKRGAALDDPDMEALRMQLAQTESQMGKIMSIVNVFADSIEAGERQVEAKERQRRAQLARKAQRIAELDEDNLEEFDIDDECEDVVENEYGDDEEDGEGQNQRRAGDIYSHEYYSQMRTLGARDADDDDDEDDEIIEEESRFETVQIRNRVVAGAVQQNARKVNGSVEDDEDDDDDDDDDDLDDNDLVPNQKSNQQRNNITSKGVNSNESKQSHPLSSSSSININNNMTNKSGVVGKNSARNRRRKNKKNK
jgi:hypothetical protein